MGSAQRSETHDIIVVGTSAGGVMALKRLLPQFRSDLPAAVLIVIHLHPGSPSYMSQILAKVARVPVFQATDGDALSIGVAYVASPDRHLIVKKGQIRLSNGPRENLARPSADALFRSAAESYSSRVIGVVLTGMLDDGTAGSRAIKRCGGVTVVQDPADAEHPSMPESAIALDSPDHVVKLDEMGELLTELAHQPAGPPVDIPADILLENRIAEGSLMRGELTESWGEATNIVCPDCGGPILREMGKDGKFGRYRCVTGHGFTSRTLAAEQSDTLERMLWQVALQLEQRGEVLEILAAEERARGNNRAAEELQRQAEHAIRQAAKTKEGIVTVPPPRSE